MIQISTMIKYTGPPDAVKRQLAVAMREGLSRMGEAWHKRFLPLHFETLAYTRYGSTYKRRSAKYERRKRNKRPMDFSGEMRGELIGRAEIRATGKRVKIGLSARALNFASPGNVARGYPDFRAELQAVAGSEEKTLTRELDQYVTRQLNRNRTKKTKRFGR